MMSYAEIRITPKDIEEYKQKIWGEFLNFLSKKDLFSLSISYVSIDDRYTSPEVKEDREKRWEAAKKVYDEFKKRVP